MEQWLLILVLGGTPDMGADSHTYYKLAEAPSLAFCERIKKDMENRSEKKVNLVCVKEGGN